jgi:prepilin-type N-terminal cleavage/methylation domain-containing protein
VRRRCGERGFSLIEVMCAVLILGVALAGLTMGISTGISSVKDSELQSTAAFLAAGQIEELRADDLVVDGVKEGEFGEAFPLYRWKRTIESGNIPGLHEVAVTVEQSRTGKEVYTLKTMLFDPPLDKATERSKERKKEKAKERSRG